MYSYDLQRYTSKMAHWSLRLVLVAAALSIPQPALSYVVGTPDDVMSRFANLQCDVIMTVGRTPSSAMPPEWAASGGKLGLPLRVKFSAAGAGEPPYSSPHESLLGESSSTASLFPTAVTPLNEPSFVSMRGVETVRVEPGRFSCRLDGGSHQHSFRFFLDFVSVCKIRFNIMNAIRAHFRGLVFSSIAKPDGAVKNDVSLPAERIYFVSDPPPTALSSC